MKLAILTLFLGAASGLSNQVDELWDASEYLPDTHYVTADLMEEYFDDAKYLIQLAQSNIGESPTFIVFNDGSRCGEMHHYGMKYFSSYIVPNGKKLLIVEMPYGSEDNAFRQFLQRTDSAKPISGIDFVDDDVLIPRVVAFYPESKKYSIFSFIEGLYSKDFDKQWRTSSVKKIRHVISSSKAHGSIFDESRGHLPEEKLEKVDQEFYSSMDSCVQQFLEDLNSSTNDLQSELQRYDDAAVSLDQYIENLEQKQ